MAKLTRAQLEGQVTYHEQGHHLYMCALQYVIRGDASVVCTSHDGKGNKYVYRACGETRADGGFVLVTFHCAGQLSDTRVGYIEQEYQHARDTAHASEDTRRHYESMSKVLMHRGRYLEERAQDNENRTA